MVSKMFVLCYLLVGVSWSYLTMHALCFSCVGKQKPTNEKKFVWPEKSRSQIPQKQEKSISRQKCLKQKPCIFLKETNFWLRKKTVRPERKKNIIWLKKSHPPLWKLVFISTVEVHWLIPVSIGAAGLLQPEGGAGDNGNTWRIIPLSKWLVTRGYKPCTNWDV